MVSRPPSHDDPVSSLLELIGLGIAICCFPLVLALVIGLVPDAPPVIAILAFVLVGMGTAPNEAPPATRSNWLEERRDRRRHHQGRRPALARHESRRDPRPPSMRGEPKPAPVLHLIAIETSSAACPYCGGGFDGVATSCPSCDTPHHGTCWAENRGCTIYACGSLPRRRRSLQG